MKGIVVLMKSSALSPQDDALTERIIGAAFRVHRALGPGLLEGLYQNALGVELGKAGITYRREVTYQVSYLGVVLGESRLDLVVADKVVIELKAIEALAQVHRAQLLTYLKTSGLPIGLLINLGSEQVQVKRLLNTPKNQ
ncbi:MAG TPA: GxxExxY protein [Gemmatimonadales bacterium]|nr:GxxExxY protein [Gemmatimonadales bacterium]